MIWEIDRNRNRQTMTSRNFPIGRLIEAGSSTSLVRHPCSLACARLVHNRLSRDTAGTHIICSGDLSTGFETRLCMACDPAPCAIDAKPIPRWFSKAFYSAQNAQNLPVRFADIQSRKEKHPAETEGRLLNSMTAFRRSKWSRNSERKTPVSLFL